MHDTDTYTHDAHHCERCERAAFDAGMLAGERRRKMRNAVFLVLVVYLFGLLLILEVSEAKTVAN